LKSHRSYLWIITNITAYITTLYVVTISLNWIQVQPFLFTSGKGVLQNYFEILRFLNFFHGTIYIRNANVQYRPDTAISNWYHVIILKKRVVGCNDDLIQMMS